MDSKSINPRFPFGFGLSYTTFTYSNLSINPTSSGYTIQFTVQNSGSVPGTEIPQLYLGFPSGAGEPPKVLRGFEEVRLLEAGQSSLVTMKLSTRDIR